MKSISIAIALAMSSTNALQAQTGDLLDRAVARYQGVRTARADFRQTLSNPLTGSTHVSKGILLRRAPNYLSVVFEGPEGDRIVGDGRWLWIYSPSSAPGQVLKLPSGSGRGSSLDPGGQFLSSPRSRYEVRLVGAASLGNRKTRLYELVPKRANQSFVKARVWIDERDAIIRQFETTDATGLVRLVEILTWRPNIPVPRSTFDFVPPPGTRIVDQSVLTGSSR